MLCDHLRQSSIGHRAFVEIGADQRDSALLEPAIHLLASKTPLGLLAAEQAAGAMDSGIERGLCLGGVDSLQDHGVIAHRATDEALLAGECWRRALAYHPQILAVVGLAPGVVVVVVDGLGDVAADDLPHTARPPTRGRRRSSAPPAAWRRCSGGR